MTDDEKSIHVSLAVGHLDLVHYFEKKENPKGIRAREVGRVIDQSMRLIDLFRLFAWEGEKSAKASRFLDEVERLTAREFGVPKLVGRDERGRFVKLEEGL